MDKQLRQIVQPQYSFVDIVVDTKKLRKLTTRHELTFVNTLEWNRVRSFSVVHTTKPHGFLSNLSGKPTKGCYVDSTGEWVLLADDDSENIQRCIERCPAEMEYLFVGFTVLTKLTIPPLTSLRQLDLVQNKQLAELNGLPALSSLEVLRIENTKLQALILPALDTLRALHLRYNPVLTKLHGLSSLSSLEILELHRTKLKQLNLPAWETMIALSLTGNDELKNFDGLYGLRSLKKLDLSQSKFDFTLDLMEFPSLQHLDISYSRIRGILMDRKMERLQTLNLSGTRFSDMAFLSNCPSLGRLSLENCPIRRIPDEIRQMKKLRSLSLRYLSLEELPDWLPELELKIGTDYLSPICLRDTKIEGVDMRIFGRSQNMIQDWFRAQKEAKEAQEESKKGKPLNEIKVVFLGDGSTGKSLTVARLLADGAVLNDFNGEATPGIAIEDRSYDLPDGRNVQVHFWDFGGQEILHSMHRIFLSDRTLYVVMINARNNTQDDQARYWLHNVSSFAPGCPVILVLNQIDQNPNASINERSLRKLYPNLQQIIRLSALTFDQATFNRTFTEQMLIQIAAFKSLGTIFPPTWKTVMDKIRGMDGNYIRGREYNQICQDSGVDGQALRLDLLKWFNDIGVSFCCGKSARLRDYVVLKPQWITNAIYTIIWNKRPETANGMVDREEIYRMLSSEAGADVKQVRSDMLYRLEDVDYVLSITRQFRLSFPMDNGKEFIPMLCDADALSEVDSFLEESGVIEFRMEYDYLPNNVLHRLMVDMRQDLISDKVWLTGALLRQRYNKIDAMVKSEGNVLSIYIKAGDAAHKAHTYLNTLRDALDAIHRDMGLKEPETLVAYKEDGQVEYFPYELLEGSRQNSVEMLYSRVFRRMIPIDDILNGTDSLIAQQKEKLLHDLVKACIQLQENRLMYDSAEDDRNDALRNTLINMGYYVADQTHTGTGGTGKRAGSLDLQLRHQDGSVWTNLEAMNLKSASDSQLKYWDKHLNKLIDNYNGAGLPTLFLISYVHCTADRFHVLCDTYMEHVQEYAPPKTELRDGTLTEIPIPDGQYAYLRVTRCTYDLSGTPVTVYHYFVGFTKGIKAAEEDSEE